jgi:DNA/RNA endonuclease YhcR with UshA esterase domain
VRKLLLFLAASLAITLPEFAADISPNLAANHIGQTVTVSGVVSQVFVTKQNNVFLNFGGVYPHHLFSAVVGKRRSPQMLADGAQWLKDLEGKNVAVTGEIQIYAGKPEIVIRSRENLRILETMK